MLFAKQFVPHLPEQSIVVQRLLARDACCVSDVPYGKKRVRKHRLHHNHRQDFLAFVRRSTFRNDSHRLREMSKKRCVEGAVHRRAPGYQELSKFGDEDFRAILLGHVGSATVQLAKHAINDVWLLWRIGPIT